MPRLYLPFQTC